MRSPRSRQGLTLIEFVVAGSIALLVVIVLGRIVLSNKTAFDWNVDKTLLQQNATEAVEKMARSVRAARTLAVTSSSAFSTYDETGALAHTYMRSLVSGEWRIREDGHDLVERACTRFAVVPDEDTTSVKMTLELEDGSGNRVEVGTQVTMRNRHYEF